MVKRLTTIAVMAMAMWTWADEVSVTAVTAQQRYPWNGALDMTVSLNSASNEVDRTACSFVATHGATLAATFIVDGLTPSTQTTEVPVPYAWLKEQFPGIADDSSAYEVKAKETAANGMSVVDCYVAGLSVADPQSELRAVVELVGDKVCLSWMPNLNTGSVVRIYKVWGRVNLKEDDWETPVQPWHRFFKVSVAMPTGADGEETAVAGDGFVPQEKPLGGVQLWENGPFWAECNVGASKPEECGYYFCWGDTVGYTSNGVTWVSSAGTPMDVSPFVYNTCQTYGKNYSELQSLGYIDSTGNLAAAHDAATRYLGAPWRMPTDAEFSELISKCDTTWTERNGVYGRLVVGKGAYSSNSIFLPAAGDGYGFDLYNLDSQGYYWSSTPYNSAYAAWYISFSSDDFNRDCYGGRAYGQSVRPLRGVAK